MKFVPDIIEDFLSSLDYSAEVWTAVYDGVSTTTIGIYNILHLRAGLFVTIDSLVYEVQSVDYANNRFVLLGDHSAATLVTLPQLHFFHGTQLAVNAELTGKDDNQKVPMCFLHEVIRESLGGVGARYSEASIRLFFLDVSNYTDWTTNQHYAKAIRPMRNFADYFIQQLRKPNKNFRAGDNTELFTHAKFGAWRENGHFQSVFNAKLSGVELQITLLISDCNLNKGLNATRYPERITGGLELALEGALIG